QSSFGISQVSFNESMEFHNISYNTDFFCSYGDVNNDGYPEILNMSQSTVFHESPRLYWYDNVNGDLNFNSRKVVNPDSVVILNAVLIDIDNDGFLDIFGNVNNQLFWFKNMDGSSFGNRLSIGSHNEIDAYNYFLPFDFNQDGFTDIVVGNDLGKMYVLFNQQNSTLSSPQVLQFANSINLSDARNFKFFDFNNDGHMDLLFNGFFILNDGNNVFFKLINVGQGERKISSINLDNNDYTDFVIYNRVNLILRKYFWSNVNNDFYFEDLIIDSFEYLWNNQGNIYLAVGDLDNDGFSDIILPEYATNTSSFSNINYYKNLNNEIFEKKVIKENSYRVSNLLIDDF